MTKQIQRVLILGGYGNFGSVIASVLAKEPDIQLVIAGRSLHKAQVFAQGLNATHPVQACQIDVEGDLAPVLSELCPSIVIHTCGPFQQRNYAVAQASIDAGAHYIDLADGREFVEGISALDEQAQRAGVMVVSGASSVPCLTSAIIDHYLPTFSALHELDYGISTAQKTTRGLATTAAILGYTGKPFTTRINGTSTRIYGWQGLRARKYPGLGWRLLGYCDVPDLALFPKRYSSLKTIRFYAGLEIPLLHLMLWGLSWTVRMDLVRRLQRYAAIMLHMSFWFDWLGSANSAFHMHLTGTDAVSQHSKTIRFELIARSGDGPHIPCMPAILLTRQLLAQQHLPRGAMPCMGLVSYDAYLDALKTLDIHWHVSEATPDNVDKRHTST